MLIYFSPLINVSSVVLSISGLMVFRLSAVGSALAMMLTSLVGCVVVRRFGWSITHAAAFPMFRMGDG